MSTKLKTLKEYNETMEELYQYENSGKTGIECPNCKNELYETSINTILLSYPPKKEVHCKECNYTNYIVV